MAIAHLDSAEFDVKWLQPIKVLIVFSVLKYIQRSPPPKKANN